MWLKLPDFWTHGAMTQAGNVTLTYYELELWCCYDKCVWKLLPVFMQQTQRKIYQSFGVVTFVSTWQIYITCTVLLALVVVCLHLPLAYCKITITSACVYIKICSLMSFKVAGGWILKSSQQHIDRARLAVFPCFYSLCKANQLQTVIQTWHWYQSSHVILSKKTNEHIVRIQTEAEGL